MSAAVERYYRNSGAVPFGGMVRMLVLGGLAATVLSLVYSLATYYLPSVKLHFVLTLCFGALMGFVVRQSAFAGKIRNRIYCSLVGLAIGLLTLYTAWVWFLWIVFEYDTDFLIFDPAIILNFIQFFGENGLWEMNGRMVGKWELYTGWILEAATILIAATVTAASIDKPFCERCNAWTEGADDVGLLALTDHARVRQALEDGQYEIVDELRSAEINPADCLHASALQCPQCRETTFLTVAQVTTTPTRDGENVKRTEIVKHLIVPREVAESALAGSEQLTTLQDLFPAASEGAAVAGTDGPAAAPEAGV